MRIRRLKNSEEIIKNSKYVIEKPENYKGKWQTLFNNNNPINLEIGMGKGDFIIGKAKNFPNENFIGIERFDSVISRALYKLESENLPNLKIIIIDAENINDVFDSEIETLFLNFSDPWPKARHAKRRLTSSLFLEKYENIFKNKCQIIQKTDNVLLFESSLVSLSNYGYIIKKVSLDLWNTDIPNIITEYETKFSNLGFKINYLEVEKEKKK